MSKLKEILNQVTLYSVASQVTQIVAMVGGVLTRNFLGPVQMGIWSTLKLFLEYSKYSTLGTTTATAREIPYYIGKKDPERAAEIKNVVTSFGSLTSLVTAVIIFIASFFLKPYIEPTLFWGLLFVSAMVILQRINNIMIALLRAYKEFELASRQMVISAFVNLLLIVALAYPFKIYGFMWAMILSLAFNIAYLSFYYRFDFRFVLNRRLGELIAFGFPLMLVNIASTVLKSVDKIMIIKMLGFKAMGLYSVAIMATNLLGRIPNAVGIILIPHFQEKFGERDSVEDVRGYIEKSTLGFSTLMPVMIGIGWITAPFFVSLLLPHYVDSVPALKFLILSSFFFAVSMPYADLIIVLKKHLLLFPLIIGMIILAVGLNYWAIQQGMGIEGVALMTTVVLMCHFLVLFLISAKQLYKFGEGFRSLMDTLARFVFLWAVLIGIDAWVQLDHAALTFCLQTTIFLALNVPFMVYINKRMNLVQFYKQKFFKPKS